jgi:hypothetical protein
VLLIAAVLGGFLAYQRALAPPSAAVGSSRFSSAIIIDWNQELVRILDAPGVQPAAIHPTRSFAILNAAMYDAVQATTDDRRPYLFSVTAAPGARPDTAAAEAARDTLAALYPGQKPAFDGMLEKELTAMPDSPTTLAGYEAGQVTAALLLANRASDGSTVAASHVPAAAGPGAYRATPPDLEAPAYTRWAYVTPFVLRARDQFRPAPPATVTSAAYSSALDEVRRLGGARSSARTSDQTEIAKFWAGSPWTSWNEIAQKAAAAHSLDLVAAARLFAVISLAFADTTIAVYDAKYRYLRSRPVTAIRQAIDPSWTPLIRTAADPSYPDLQSAIATAGAEVLERVLGGRDHISVTSDALPGVVRTFNSYAAAADETGLSTVYAGVNTRLDGAAGLELGRQVADFVVAQSTGPAFGA